MATRNVVPRANHEGQIGRDDKYWKAVYADNIYAEKITATSTDDPTEDTDVINKGYLDKAIEQAIEDCNLDQYVTKEGDETITGAKVFTNDTTFNGAVTVDTIPHYTGDDMPLEDGDLATKAYADSLKPNVRVIPLNPSVDTDMDEMYPDVTDEDAKIYCITGTQVTNQPAEGNNYYLGVVPFSALGNVVGAFQTCIVVDEDGKSRSFVRYGHRRALSIVGEAIVGETIIG